MNNIIIEKNDSVKLCERGDLFNIDDEIYMLVNPYWKSHTLISLSDGNNWSDYYNGDLVIDDVIKYIKIGFDDNEISVKYLGNRTIYIKE